MGYDKPKVTIDLEEYNELKSMVNQLRNEAADSDAALYKKAIFHSLNCRGSLADTVEACKRDGVYLTYLDIGTARDQFERIFVSKMDKKNAQ